MTDSLQSVSVLMPVIIRHDWQLVMTRCAIETLRCTTDVPFQLVIVEAEGSRMHPATLPSLLCEEIYTGNVDGWHSRGDVTRNGAADINCGLDQCRGDLVVYTGNDVFTRPDWLRALLACFQISDCGAATLASRDLSGRPDWAAQAAAGGIREGIYGPFMMFPRTWRFDAARFPWCFGDTDLITRIYRGGQRMYRNWDVSIQHLNRQTIGEDEQAHQRDFQGARERYIAKHRDCPLMIFRALSEGWPI